MTVATAGKTLRASAGSRLRLRYSLDRGRTRRSRRARCRRRRQRPTRASPLVSAFHGPSCAASEIGVAGVAVCASKLVFHERGGRSFFAFGSLCAASTQFAQNTRRPSPSLISCVSIASDRERVPRYAEPFEPSKGREQGRVIVDRMQHTIPVRRARPASAYSRAS